MNSCIVYMDWSNFLNELLDIQLFCLIGYCIDAWVSGNLAYRWAHYFCLYVWGVRRFSCNKQFYSYYIVTIFYFISVLVMCVSFVLMHKFSHAMQGSCSIKWYKRVYLRRLGTHDIDVVKDRQEPDWEVSGRSSSLHRTASPTTKRYVKAQFHGGSSINP